MRVLIGLSMALLASPAARADDPKPAGVPIVPATHPELNQFLEGSKRNQPRLPLPPLTEEEKAKAGQGDWSVVNNGRMRKLYLSEISGGGAAGFVRDPDPALTLSSALKTMSFWIVSRANNCTYCRTTSCSYYSSFL